MRYVKYCNCNRMLLFAPTYDMTMQVSQKIYLKNIKNRKGKGLDLEKLINY